MSHSSNRQPETPKRLADRYLVEERVGEGATAVTWRGWDERLERPVAIKVLRHDHSQDPTFVQRFRQEARSAASVASGNVVDVYDFGEQDGELYIVMQYVDGGDLKHLINEEAPLPFERVRRIAGQVLDGLQAIHNAGIVHRDIKPQNVLIGRDGHARLTDFGVAHLEQDSGLTTVGTTVGTASYMAPEQAQGGRITEACDIYAVGVMLYEMLTGFLPFNGPTPMATMLEHIQSRPVPPSQRLPGHGISPDMDAVVLQALEKDPARRFRSARAMKQALGQALRNPADRRRMDDATTMAAPAMTERYTAPERGPAEIATPGPELPRRSTSERMPARQHPEAFDDPNPGSGLTKAVKALLWLLLLALLAFGGWFAVDQLTNRHDTEPTPTLPAVVETIVPTDPPTNIPEVVATDVPTDVPMPTTTAVPSPTDTPMPSPTDTPVPTATNEPTPTVVPTDMPVPTSTRPLLPVPTPTSDVPVIEPIEITPPA